MDDGGHAGVGGGSTSVIQVPAGLRDDQGGRCGRGRSGAKTAVVGQHRHSHAVARNKIGWLDPGFQQSLATIGADNPRRRVAHHRRREDVRDDEVCSLQVMSGAAAGRCFCRGMWWVSPGATQLCFCRTRRPVRRTRRCRTRTGSAGSDAPWWSALPVDWPAQMSCAYRTCPWRRLIAQSGQSAQSRCAPSGPRHSAGD